jgi:hypothetical protein
VACSSKDFVLPSENGKGIEKWAEDSWNKGFMDV